MIRTCLFALCTLLFAAASHAQDAGTSRDNPYWRLKQARIDAYRTGDRAYFESLLSPDFISLAPDGRRIDRQAYLAAEFAPGQREALRTETQVSDFSAARSGSTLALSYVETERTPVGANIFETRLARLDVYVRSDGRWRLLTMTAVKLPEAPQVIPLAAEKLDDYAGVYAFGPGLDSTVRVSDGKLVEQTTGQGETHLLPVGQDTFYAPPDLEARISFERDAAGKVVAQIYRAGAQSLRAPRTR